MENIDVVRGYFEAIKKNKNPKDFIQLSYLAFNVVGKDLWKVHAEKIKGQPLNIELVSETELTVPFVRTNVQFTLNGELYMAVIIKEKEPDTGRELLYNWVSINGKPGLNPCSLRTVNLK